MDGESRGSRQSPKSKSTPSSRACEECNRKKAKCQFYYDPIYYDCRRCDKSYPICLHCKRNDKACVYPTKRKGPDPKFRRQQFQRDLLEGHMNGELDELLGLIDISILQSVIARRVSTQSTPRSQVADDTRQHYGKEDETWVNLQDPANLQVDHPGLVGGNEIDYSLGGTLTINNDEGFNIWTPDSCWGSMNLDPLSNCIINTHQLHDINSNLLELNESVPATTDQMPMEGVLTGSTIPWSLSLNQGTYSLAIPAVVVDDLIETFFRRVQGFIPLLHRPNLLQKCNVHGSDDRRYKYLQNVDVFVLAGMFALSARFSSSSYFVGTAPKERGAPFAAQAKSIYIDLMRPDKPARSSLSFLQGCILLAYYEETCGPSFESWLSVGICSRLASELGLDKIDEDLIGVDYSSQWKSPNEWVEREEKRRAWWLVWELDVFASTVLNRPRAIDKSQIHVLLPVSDAQWFNNCPISSTFIIPDVANAWKTLQDCPNQDVRAWFLVCTFFMATAHDMSRKHKISAQDLADFESSRGCFSLLLPLTFSLCSSSLTFTESNFSTSNWVVSTIFMLNTIRLLTRDYQIAKSMILASGDRMICKTKSIRDLTYYGDDNDIQLVFRAIRAWYPEFIAFACPFVVCTLVGPAAANIRLLNTTNISHSKQDLNFNINMLKLVLERIGNFWEIGSSALSLVKCLETIQRGNHWEKGQKLSSSLSLLVPVEENDNIDNSYVPGISNFETGGLATE